jgi:hypothetical protein
MKRSTPGNSWGHEGSSLVEHRAALVAAVPGKRGRRYLKRQQLLELGEPAIRYLTEIVHRRPQQWFQDVDRLHAILQSHGPEVLRLAMEAGLEAQVFGAFYVERCLQGAEKPELSLFSIGYGRYEYLFSVVFRHIPTRLADEKPAVFHLFF